MRTQVHEPLWANAAPPSKTNCVVARRGRFRPGRALCLDFVAKPEPTFTLAPYDYAEARTLERELGVAEPVAAALVRRGHGSPAAARAFLEANEVHDPFEFGGMAEVVDRLRAAAAGKRRITVH